MTERRTGEEALELAPYASFDERVAKDSSQCVEYLLDHSGFRKDSWSTMDGVATVISREPTSFSFTVRPRFIFRVLNVRSIGSGWMVGSNSFVIGQEVRAKGQLIIHRAHQVEILPDGAGKSRLRANFYYKPVSEKSTRDWERHSVQEKTMRGIEFKQLLAHLSGD